MQKTSYYKKPVRKAHLPIKRQLKWSFEETDFRKPCQNITRVLDDANHLSKVIEECEMNSNIKKSYSSEDEDLLMTTHLITELTTVNLATQSDNEVSISIHLSQDAQSVECLEHSGANVRSLDTSTSV